MGIIYRSPNGSDENNLLLLSLLQEVSKIKHDHIIIAGDFNLKEIDWDTRQVKGSVNSYQYKVFDCVNDLFQEQTIKESTRFRRTNIPSKLDWVLTENPQCMSNKAIGLPLGLSDHALISIEYDCVTDKDAEDDIINYSFCHGNYSAMKDELQSINWPKKIKDLNTQQLWDSFHSVITGLIERHVPKKKYTSSKNPPWYGREIGILNKDKKGAWKAYKRNPTSENWNVYAKLRNTLSHNIEHLKSEYENKIASEVKIKSKKNLEVCEQQNKQ